MGNVLSEVFSRIHFLGECSYEGQLCPWLFRSKLLGNRVPIISTIALVPPLLFVGYLMARLRYCVRIIKDSDGLVLPLYYTFVWITTVTSLLVLLFDLFWNLTGLEDSNAISGDSSHGDWFSTVWRLLLSGLSHRAIDFINESVQLSVIIFMLHQHSNLSTVSILFRTALISLFLAFFDQTFDFVFTMVDQTNNSWFESTTLAELYHGFSDSLFFFVYLGIIVLAFTPLRRKLPDRLSFYVYCAYLVVVYGLIAIGVTLNFFCISVGICANGISFFLYECFYPVVLYFCFLSTFFSKRHHSEILDLEPT